MLIVHTVRSLRPAQIIGKQFLPTGGIAQETHYDAGRTSPFGCRRFFDWWRGQIPSLAVIVDY